MIIIFRTTLVFILLLLTACAHFHNQAQTQSAFIICKAGCDQRYKVCNNTCRNNCQQCSAYAAQSISESYLYYRHEQTVKGGVIARELNSYRDPLQCRKTTCNCWGDYQICIQSCGGVVHKALQVAPVC